MVSYNGYEQIDHRATWKRYTTRVVDPCGQRPNPHKGNGGSSIAVILVRKSVSHVSSVSASVQSLLRAQIGNAVFPVLTDIKTKMAVSEGGWGWVVVLCCFYQHTFAASAVYSLSVYYISWVMDFETGRGITSWVMTLSMAFSMGAGPIVASLSARFGHRPVVIAGAVISALGFFASCFVTSVYALIAFVGAVSGLGQGMQYLPSLALIPFYFQKKRSFAMGIAMSGSGVGTFLYPTFLIWLEEQYTWRGAMLIVSGLILNVAVCGALLRPLEITEEDLESEHGNNDEQNGEIKTDVIKIVDVQPIDVNEDSIEFNETSKNNGVHLLYEDSVFSLGKGNKDVDTQNPLLGKGGESKNIIDKQKSVILFKTPLFCNDSNGSVTCLSQQTHLSNINDDANGHSVIPLQSSAPMSSSGNVHLPSQLKSFYKQSPALARLKGNAAPRSNSLQQLRMPQTEASSERQKFSSVVELRKNFNTNKSSTCLSTSASVIRGTGSCRSNVDILLSNSIFDLDKADKRRNSALRQRLYKDTEGAQTPYVSLRHDSTRLLDIHTSQTFTRKESVDAHSVELSNGLSHMPSKPKIWSFGSSLPTHFKIYIDIMKNPYFATFSLVNFLNSLTYLMPVVYIVDRAVDNGVDKADAALAFSMYGAGNLFGRVAIGLLADQGFNSLLLGAACLMGCGVSTCLSPLCGANAVMHGIYGFAFGTSSGGFVTLTPLILVDLLGLSLVSRSYGLTLLFQALGYVAGTPVAG
ncbi:hypothetical protein RRG08_008925 [Elysia crispata]|uniref:Monocarboxylate transporter 12 n=1 Tax=Elysia crispata TaxID=231223 RepID=A0AAE0ZX08_9GAST|nr:hypothetical protein RRG08_008925 [Elysia crispata]